MQTTVTIETPALEKFKDHFRRHKEKYLFGAAGIVVGGTIVYIWKDSLPDIHLNDSMAAINSPNAVVTKIEIIKPGNSGDILWDRVRQMHHMSKGEASRNLEISRAAVNKLIDAGELILIQPGDVTSLEVAG